MVSTVKGSCPRLSQKSSLNEIAERYRKDHSNAAFQLIEMARYCIVECRCALERNSHVIIGDIHVTRETAPTIGRYGATEFPQVAVVSPDEHLQTIKRGLI